jgi:hypothetical protein
VCGYRKKRKITNNKKDQTPDRLYLLGAPLVIYCAAESSTNVNPSNALSNEPK